MEPQKAVLDWSVLGLAWLLFARFKKCSTYPSSWQDLSSQPVLPAAPILSPRTVAHLGDVALVGLSYCVTSGAQESTALQNLKQTLLQDVAKIFAAHPPVLHGMLVSLRARCAGTEPVRLG